MLAERAHLEELRVIALEDRAAARLALGDHATAAAELETLTGQHPLRERLWALRVLALVRSGRQADALDALGRVRTVLADELGLDPGAELRDLQARVLAQDEELFWSAPAGPRADPQHHRSERRGREAPGSAGRRPSGAAARERRSPEPGWPLFGRDDELARLVRRLDRAEAGEAGFGVVTGEPGIGKSRLCAELAARARARGATVLVGRCSQDDGAPPLWPWELALRTLGVSVPGDPVAGRAPRPRTSPGRPAGRGSRW